MCKSKGVNAIGVNDIACMKHAYGLKCLVSITLVVHLAACVPAAFK